MSSACWDSLHLIHLTFIPTPDPWKLYGNKTVCFKLLNLCQFIIWQWKPHTFSQSRLNWTSSSSFDWFVSVVYELAQASTWCVLSFNAVCLAGPCDPVYPAESGITVTWEGYALSLIIPERVTAQTFIVPEPGHELVQRNITWITAPVILPDAKQTF